MNQNVRGPINVALAILNSNPTTEREWKAIVGQLAYAKMHAQKMLELATKMNTQGVKDERIVVNA